MSNRRTTRLERLTVYSIRGLNCLWKFENTKEIDWLSETLKRLSKFMEKIVQSKWTILILKFAVEEWSIVAVIVLINSNERFERLKGNSVRK